MLNHTTSRQVFCQNPSQAESRLNTGHVTWEVSLEIETAMRTTSHLAASLSSRSPKTWLVGGWATPLKNIYSSIGMMTFPTNMEKSSSHVPVTNQMGFGLPPWPSHVVAVASGAVLVRPTSGAGAMPQADLRGAVAGAWFHWGFLLSMAWFKANLMGTHVYISLYVYLLYIYIYIYA